MERRQDEPVVNNEADWIEHDGKEMPVNGATLVVVKYRDGEVDLEAAEACSWGIDGIASCWSHEFETSDDIVAYREVTA